MKALNWIFIFSLVCQIGFGQELRVKTNKDAIRIGEQVALELTLKTTRGDEVAFPILMDTLTSGLEIVKASKIDTNETSDSLTLHQNLTLTSFDSGYYAVSPIKATVNGDTIFSDPFLVVVETVELDTNQAIYDIKGIAAPPFSIKEFLKKYWHLILLAILLTLGVAFAVYKLFFSKEIEKKEIIKPIIPPHITALKRLEELAEKQLWQAGKIKEYYVELTEILRWFIEARFGIYALEQTTDELMKSIKHQPDFSKEEQEKIHRLLFLADLVKFAKEKPVASENEMHFDHVKAFIEAHIPVVEPEKSNDQNAS